MTKAIKLMLNNTFILKDELQKKLTYLNLGAEF